MFPRLCENCVSSDVVSYSFLLEKNSLFWFRDISNTIIWLWFQYYCSFLVFHSPTLLVHGEMFWIRFLFCSMHSSFMDLPRSFYCSTASTFTAPSAHRPYLVSCSIRGDILAVRGTWRCRRCPQALEGLQDSSGPWPAPGQRQQLGQQPDPWRWPPPYPRAKPSSTRLQSV